MSYVNQSLSTGEKLEALFKQHWFVRLPMVVWILLGIPTLGLTWILAIYEHLRLKYVEMGLTNKRLISKVGIISRKTQELSLYAIETVSIDQGILGRILGFGTIIATGRGNSCVIFKNVHNPMDAKRQIETLTPTKKENP